MEEKIHDGNNNDNNIELEEELANLNLQLKEQEEKIEELEFILDNVSTRFASSINQFVELLGSIVAFQEKFYENPHSRFVSSKAGAVARALSMSEEEVWQIETAGLLHDIGKIGLKDSVMAKFLPEMTEKETIYYRSHCELGRDLLKKFDEFAIVSEFVYQHHEFLDGSGFPQGLRGKQIHPGAQIVAICNTFHNLVYKVKKENDPRAVSFAVQTNIALNKAGTASSRFLSAISQLHQRAGVHFEKKFVEVFIEIIEEERKARGDKVVARVPVLKLAPGMIIYQNYYSPAGLLIAASGDVITEESKKILIRLAEFGTIPSNIIVLK